MELSDVITRIDALKSEIDALRPLDPDMDGRIVQKFRLDWNYHSSNIEGNSLTFGETKTFLLHGLTAEGKPLKDHLEIKGHNEAIHALEEFIKGERPLTEQSIRTLHQVILGEPYQIPAVTPEGMPTQRWVTPGRYKQAPNHVRAATGEVFYFASPEDAPAQMEELLAWYDTTHSDRDMHPLMLAATLHYRFIRIHPFDDGNGRIARILMNLVLMKAGYPPAIIRTEDKSNYYRALRIADGGDIEPFIEYVGEQLLRSLEIYLSGARGESADESDDVDKEIALFKAELAASSNDTPQLRRSDAVLHAVLQTSIVPLFEAVARRLSQFDELFVDHGYSIALRGDYYDAPLSVSKNSLRVNQYSSVVEAIAGLQKQFAIADVHSATIRFEWSGYKHAGVDAFNYSIEIEVSFGDFVYAIKPGYAGGVSINNPYHKELSGEEVDRIAGDIAKEMLHVLKLRQNGAAS
jgi:Fic family protein